MSKEFAIGAIKLNGDAVYFKDEDAHDAIDILNGDATTTGSVDNKIATALANIGGFAVVSSLSSVTNPDTHTMYLVKDTSVSGDDKYKEYIYNSTTSNFELIGDVSIDLSGYVQNSDLPYINNSHSYTGSSTYYAPISGGTNGGNYYLRGNGATSAPTWQTADSSISSNSNNLPTSKAVYDEVHSLIDYTYSDPGANTTLTSGTLLVVLS